MRKENISVIVPTVGRPKSISCLLKSIKLQTLLPKEIIVCDSSNNEEINKIIEIYRNILSGIRLVLIHVSIPNAVYQRKKAISKANGGLLLFLDDDIVLDDYCISELYKVFEERENAVAVMANIANQSWPEPTRLWKLYLRIFHNVKNNKWEGKVIGPLLRFGFNSLKTEPTVIEWFGTGNTLVKKDIYIQVGGFSEFFLHRSTLNEDVDLGIKFSRQGKIYFCPTAKLLHHHDPIGRMNPKILAEDDLYNRYMILIKTCNYTKRKAILLILVYFIIENISQIISVFKNRTIGNTFKIISGRIKALIKIVRYNLQETFS